MHWQPISFPQSQPAILGQGAAAAAILGRNARRVFSDPITAAVAIDARGGEIADPTERLEILQLPQMQVENGIADVVGRD